MSSNDLKEQGNRLFTARQYDDAIGCYSKAILKNPSTATYYTNRALCYLKLQRWPAAIQDCQRAIENEPRSVKGHFFLAQAHLENQSYDEAITHFKQAFDLAKDQKLNFGDDIALALRTAKKKRWSTLEEKRIAQEIELQNYLNKLILEDRERQVQKLKDSSNDTEDELNNVESSVASHMTELNDLFATIDDRRKKREVPDQLCGKISFEIMRDPVITPCGITYDKKDIEEHLQRVGHFDPITRAPLNSSQLIPNLAMKEVIDEFLQKNEWAEDA